ncbi:tRNA methyltransferase ppm2, variant 3 [Xanthoria parietina]
MHAVEQTVLGFLKEPSKKRKIVLNLGCGYDPLPFQCLSKYPEDCAGVTFVDVDFPELISKKRDIILEHSELQTLVGPIQSDGQDRLASALQSTDSGLPILIRSNRYVGVGCDLRDIARLSKALEEELQIGNCLVLCSAEVSITYMDVDAADALITWAVQYDNIRFCMLEQLLPQGQKHPFAQKMMQHFVKLGTPLRCVQKYPLLQDQEERFLRAGYHSVQARTLWQLWQDQSAVAPDLRLHLNKAEPFDEWEEFALFSSHYFILVAMKSPTSPPSPNNQGGSIPKYSKLVCQPQVWKSRSIPVTDRVVLNVLSSQAKHHRKFGAAIPFSDQTIGIHGGIGDKGRLNTTARYQNLGLEAQDAKFSNPPIDIEARVCHTITALDDRRFMLAGGRTSPDKALQECWLCCSGQWKPVENLPIPLYRHGATAVAYGTVDAGILVFGGKTTGGIVVSQWFIWREASGWEEVCSSSGELLPRFAATITSTSTRRGILLGGMTEDGILCDEVWEWTIGQGQETDITLQLKALDSFRIAPRFGAFLAWSPVGLLIIGGISTLLIPLEEEILRLSNEAYGKVDGSTVFEPTAISIDFDGHRPLLIGHAICASRDAVLITGGGAVCFSFGSYWNMTAWTLHFSAGCEPNSPVRHFAEVVVPPYNDPARELHAEDAERASPAAQSNNVAEAVQRVRIGSEADFNRLMHEGRPFVMEGLDLGECMTDWTVPELVRKISPDRLVTVHEAQGCHMNFQLKNFQYVKKPFGKFMQEVCDGSLQYLRSLNAEKAADEPARFADDFPGLSDQFHLPPQLATVARNQHSSPLRISGPVNMWLHYDVMANVLCTILGEKVLVLYPPLDAVHFKIPPGSSSSPMAVFHPEQRGSVVYPRHHIRAVLKEGDILYIPPLWLHSASPLDNLSVSINVFFRNLISGYAAGRDVYGNRDVSKFGSSIVPILLDFETIPGKLGIRDLD